MSWRTDSRGRDAADFGHCASLINLSKTTFSAVPGFLSSSSWRHAIVGVEQREVARRQCLLLQYRYDRRCGYLQVQTFTVAHAQHARELDWKQRLSFFFFLLDVA